MQIKSDLDSRLQNILIDCWYTDGRTPRHTFVSDMDQLEIRKSPECAEFVFQLMMKTRLPQKRLTWLKRYYELSLDRFARRMCLDLPTTKELFERAIDDTIAKLKEHENLYEKL